jgi:hypothetical protein
MARHQCATIVRQPPHSTGDWKCFQTQHCPNLGTLAYRIVGALFIQRNNGFSAMPLDTKAFRRSSAPASSTKTSSGSLKLNLLPIAGQRCRHPSREAQDRHRPRRRRSLCDATYEGQRSYFDVQQAAPIAGLLSACEDTSQSNRASTVK